MLRRLKNNIIKTCTNNIKEEKINDKEIIQIPPKKQ